MSTEETTVIAPAPAAEVGEKRKADEVVEANDDAEKK